MSRYLITIGLEVHVQLLTATKLFCGCPNRFGDPPNALVCPVCLGQPGALPVLNERALDQGIAVGLALGARIADVMRFDRKHYFYPDLPKGYQISQLHQPLCLGGALELEGDDRALRPVGIVRAHLEEDAGKLVHGGAGVSHVDLDRAGVPLVEIVTAPDLRSPEEAQRFLTDLRNLVRWIGASDGNMEEGSLRCDANISLRRGVDEPLGRRCEIKNLNSFKAVRDALEYEAARQGQLLDAGERVPQETRSFDAEAGVTRRLRSKEEAEDYRYFPDPDLPPYSGLAERAQRIAATLPELPRARARRYREALGLSVYEAGILTETHELSEFFEACLAAGLGPREASSWIANQVLAALRDRGQSLAELRLRPEDLAELESLVAQGAITGRLARIEVFPALLAGQGPPRRIVQERGLARVGDEAELETLLLRLFAEHPDALAKLRAGQEKTRAFFVGQAMKATRGQADAEVVQRIIGRLLREGVADAPGDSR